jgi:hypothetical protein
MDFKEQEEIIEILQEELQGFFQWMIEELGEEYYMEDTRAPKFSWETEVNKRIKERMNTHRARLWERDRYAAFEHPERPSIYQVMKAIDLEVLHYPQEDFYCEHFKIIDFSAAVSEGEQHLEKRYEVSFGVILASESLGHMYRLDFCEICGLIEIWSMIYSPEEIAVFQS